MEPFQHITNQFNPQHYESSNVPPSSDRLFSFSGYQAGLMTPSSSHSQPQPPQPFQHPMMPTISVPLPPDGNDISRRYTGMYTNTGFDMLSILSRLANRPNPQIDLGPVDLSCAFVVVDAKQYDFPMVYASPMFERLTGYSLNETIGRNCRFLQAPDGNVAIGSRRKYTDSTTVYHIKTHIVQGKESQSSIINYKKTGQPFVNLLTVVPITWDSDEIDYFVGLLVDLVEQPNEIVKNMNGIMQDFKSEDIQEWKRPQSNNKPTKELTLSENVSTSESPLEEHTDIETLIKEASVEEGKSRRYFHELLLDQSSDFIHVLTIRGVFVYCSDSVTQLLEYKPSELVGKLLSAICHPSDITTVMRELKQSSNDFSDPVNLIFRIRRKNNGYVWIECSGKLLNVEKRGRKYVMLSGRERPNYQLPRTVLAVGNKAHESRNLSVENQMHGAEDHEFWGKLSMDGLLLYVSSTCVNILDTYPQDIVGTSLYQLMRSNRTTDLTRALAEVKEGKIAYLRHALLNSSGMEIMVASNFYPDGKSALKEEPTFVLMQTRIISDNSISADEGPVFVSMDADVKKKGRGDLSLPGYDYASRSPAKIMIEELSIDSMVNWQYELHQLRINNKKLRDELGALLDKAKKNGEDEIVCKTCLRRLPGFVVDEYSDMPLKCNTCNYRDLNPSI